MRLLIPALLLTGCATASSGASSGEAELAAELQGRTAREAADCVDSSPARALDIADADTLVYRTGATIWVNHLPASCPGLRPLDQLVIEPNLSGRYCRGDRFRSLARGGTIPGAYCRLGDFTPYRRP